MAVMLQVHTVPIKVTGKCGSVSIRLVPAPRGAGIVAARVPKKVLQMAGIADCYTSSRGSRKTLGNFVKATFNALAKTYGFLTPDLWRETKYTKAPLQVRRCCCHLWHVFDGAGGWKRQNSAAGQGRCSSARFAAWSQLQHMGCMSGLGWLWAGMILVACACSA